MIHLFALGTVTMFAGSRNKFKILQSFFVAIQTARLYLKAESERKSKRSTNTAFDMAQDTNSIRHCR